jgi:hypothetical protein
LFLKSVDDCSGAQELSGKGASNGNGMSGECGDASHKALRFVEDAELPEDGGAVVIDFFSGQPVIGIEGVNATERDVNASPSSRQTAPFTQMRAPDTDFKHDSVVGYVTADDLDR